MTRCALGRLHYPHVLHLLLVLYRSSIISSVLVSDCSCSVSAVPLMKKDVVEKLPSDLNGLQTTIKRLHESLEQAHAYVDDVVVRAPLHPCIPRMARCAL